jgi:hypothetical protein
MKSSIVLSSVYPVLLVIFSSIVSTSFQTNAPALPNGDGCTVSVQKAARYGYARKQVDGRAFPKEADIDQTSLLDKMVDGNLDVCVDAKGGCQWHFLATGSKDLSFEMLGMEDVVRALLFAKGKDGPDVNAYLLSAKSNGAFLQELGNGTVSVTQKHEASKRTSVTMVDVRHNALLGSSVYRDADGALLTKLVCMQMLGKRLSMSLYVFEHGMGEKTGWVTEVQCETSI